MRMLISSGVKPIFPERKYNKLNISKQEICPLKALKSGNNIKTLPADKGPPTY